MENSQKISFFNVSTWIDHRYFDTIVNQSGKIYLSKKGDVTCMIQYVREDLMGCFDEMIGELNKDFCSSFQSSLEYNEKLYELTPHDLKKNEFAGMGNKWIVHRKGLVFRNTERIFIYESKNYQAFRHDLKKSESEKVKILIFPEKMSPDYISVSFPKKDETLINQFLSHFRDEGEPQI